MLDLVAFTKPVLDEITGQDANLALRAECAGGKLAGA